MPFDLDTIYGAEVLAGLATFVAVYGSLTLATLIWDRVQRRGRSCRWVQDTIQPHSGTLRWVCDACQETGYTQKTKPPKTCKRAIKTTL